ncbi:L-rhamnose-binding lectin CSL1 [Engraulis encrasicolus]|uniref:L-rhamnose-binding lectin CSL1 n=1 Tax=Engraulis encrasicolus TaxID=184585 RepID=UPI002FD09013
MFTKCTSDSAYSIVSDRCNGLSECSVPVTAGVLSEPCPGTRKYLTVSFMCLKARRIVACQNYYNIIRCEWPTKLMIVHANYGRRDEELCPKGNTTTTACINGVTQQVRDWCKPWGDRCYVMATDFLYSDPCHDYSKYLEVMYMCLHLNGEHGLMDS